MEFGDLKLDSMEVDCQLALKYIKENETQLSTYPFVIEELKRTKNSYGIDIFYCDRTTIDSLVVTNPNNMNSESKNYVKLAEKIKENAELFAQLEWLIRKIPKKDVKKYDINLMINNLQYHDMKIYFYRTSYLVMADDTPLAMLGSIAAQSNKPILIVATPNSAVVCNLFTRLCREAGLCHIYMAVFEDLGEFKTCIDLDELEQGCTAVITSKADVDSAVDAILHSTVKYPWKICNILVQEDTYLAVEQALHWKSTLKNGPEVNGDIKKMCKNIFSFEDKIILVEYAGSEVSLQNHIKLQTYRTVNDLRNFNNCFCISLWTNDINEANLIAYASSVDLVWVNDYGTFEGPPDVSRTVFRSIERQETRLEDRTKKLASWLKLDFNVRLNTIKQLIHPFVSEEERENFLEDCRDSTYNLCLMENGKMFTIIYQEGTWVLRRSILKGLVDLVSGKGVILNTYNKTEMRNALIKADLPIGICSPWEANLFDCLKKVKVIIQNCGTHC